jgi:hypothetical protein
MLTGASRGDSPEFDLLDLEKGPGVPEEGYPGATSIIQPWFERD